MLKVADGLLGVRTSRLKDASRAPLAGPRRKPAAAAPGHLSRRWAIDESIVAGRSITTLTPRDWGQEVTVVYLHGGAYVADLLAAHWTIVDNLARETGASVVIPSYGLAPEHTVDEAFEFVTAVVAGVRRRRPTGRVYLAGDSAGGGLALALALEMRGSALRPDGLFLFSPWVDATLSNPEARRVETIDPMLGIDWLRYWGEKWAGARSTTDPRVSPVLGDLGDLPPTWVYQGGRDLFRPDAERFAADARAAGSPVEITVYPDGFHVFVALAAAPESRAVYREIRRVLRA